MPTTESQPLYPICEDTKKLEDLGIGFPLYFLYKKYICFIYFMIVLSISIIGCTKSTMKRILGIRKIFSPTIIIHILF